MLSTKCRQGKVGLLTHSIDNTTTMRKIPCKSVFLLLHRIIRFSFFLLHQCSLSPEQWPVPAVGDDTWYLWSPTVTHSCTFNSTFSSSLLRIFLKVFLRHVRLFIVNIKNWKILNAPFFLRKLKIMLWNVKPKNACLTGYWYLVLGLPW